MDYKIRRGWVEAMMPTTFPAVPGLEVAGVVDEVGEGVTEFAIGDEVVGWATSGGYAEHAVVGVVAPKPAGLPSEQAVAIPAAGETARRVLRELGVTVSAGGTSPEQTKAGLVEQLQLAAAGDLKLRVAETFSLADAAKAQEISEGGHARGKLVIVP